MVAMVTNRGLSFQLCFCSEVQTQKIKKMKNWSQEKPGGLKSQKCKKTQVFSFLSFFHLFIIFVSFFYGFLKNHQILPSARHIFLIFWSEMLQNIRNP